MGVGPFAYIPFILVFLKFNDAAWDTRQSIHKTMGFVTYVYIVMNLAMGTTMWLGDAAAFVFVTFFFYRAMSDGFENHSVPGLATVLVFGALSLWVGWPDPNDKGGMSSAIEAATSGKGDKEFQKTLQQAQQALEKVQQAQQQNADLMK